MADVVVNDASLLDIGNAIREKNGEQTKYKPAAMGAAIRAISGGGPVIDPKVFKFKNYDGTVIAEYTPQEFAGISSLPPLPIEDAYTKATRWDVTLEDCHYMAGQDWYKANGYIMYPDYIIKKADEVCVGYIKCHIEDGYNQAIFDLYNKSGMNNAIAVDWGDGEVSRQTTSVDAPVYKPEHLYKEVNKDYVIKITSKYLSRIGNGKSNIFGKSAGGTSRDSSIAAMFGSKVKGIILEGFEIEEPFNEIITDSIEYALVGGNCRLKNGTLTGFTDQFDTKEQIPVIITTNKAQDGYKPRTSYSPYYVKIYANGCNQYRITNKHFEESCNILPPSAVTIQLDDIQSKDISIPERVTKIYNITWTAPRVIKQHITYSKNLTGVSYLPYIISGIHDFSKAQSLIPMTVDNLPRLQGSFSKILVPSSLYNQWIAATNWSALTDFIEAV